MNCPVCGKPNDDTAKFCRACGASLVDPTTVQSLADVQAAVDSLGEAPETPEASEQVVSELVEDAAELANSEVVATEEAAAEFTAQEAELTETLETAVEAEAAEVAEAAEAAATDGAFAAGEAIADAQAAGQTVVAPTQVMPEPTPAPAPATPDVAAQAAYTAPTPQATPAPQAAPTANTNSIGRKLGSVPIWALLGVAVALIALIAAGCSTNWFGLGRKSVASLAGTYEASLEYSESGISADIHGRLELEEDGDASLTVGISALGFAYDLDPVYGSWTIEGDVVKLSSYDVDEFAEDMGLNASTSVDLQIKGRSLVLEIPEIGDLLFERVS